MRYALLALPVLPLFASPAFADMIAPWHRSLRVVTTVTSEESMPRYTFYVVYYLGDEKPMRVAVEPGKATVIDLEPTRGTTLVAVPATLPDGDRVAIDVARRDKPCPPGVKSIPIDTYLHVHQLDYRDQPERHVVVRRTSDGVEFDVTREPGSSGSRRAIVLGSTLTAVAIFLGIRWARRRPA